MVETASQLMGGKTASPAVRLPAAWISAIAAVLAVACTVMSLGALRLLTAMVSGARPVLQTTTLLHMIERRPVLGIIACQVAALCLSSGQIREWCSGSVVAAGILVALWLLVFAVLRLACLTLELHPLSLAKLGRRARQAWPERYFAAHMRNPIDAYMVRDLIHNSLIIGGAWVILLRADFLPVMNYLFFFTAYFGAFAKYENFDHTNIHNRLFRGRAGVTGTPRLVLRLAEFYVDYVSSTLFLRMPLFYKIEHAHIHHFENNGLADTQSTLFYDRRSFIDFCRFAARFALDFTTAYRTIGYFVRRRRYRPLKIVIRGIVLWYAALAALFLIAPAPAIFVLGLKFFGQFFGSLSAYGWHVFADPDDPQNSFTNSFDVVTFDGHGYLGAGMHMEHHVQAGLHWSKLAAAAARHSGEHERHGATRWYDSARYTNAGTVRVILKALWSDRLDALEPLFACYGRTIPDKATLLRILQARTRPLVPIPRSTAYKRIDRSLGTFAARCLMSEAMPPADFRSMVWRRRPSRAEAAES